MQVSCFFFFFYDGDATQIADCKLLCPGPAIRGSRASDCVLLQLCPPSISQDATASIQFLKLNNHLYFQISTVGRKKKSAANPAGLFDPSKPFFSLEIVGSSNSWPRKLWIAGKSTMRSEVCLLLFRL
jgi:hypothetical protein